MSTRRRGAPTVHFTRGIDWNTWVARTSLGKVTITRRPRPKGAPQWGRWLFDLRVEFTDGTVCAEEAVTTTVRAAKRAAIAAVDAHWEADRWPKPRLDCPYVPPATSPKYPRSYQSSYPASYPHAGGWRYDRSEGSTEGRSGVDRFDTPSR